MSFLLRLELPDRPGTLGLVATALGTVGADIISVDVIERANGYAIDDLIVDLPPGRLADTLVTAATAVLGVRVESIRSYAARLDPSRELELIESMVAHPDDALTQLADGVTRIFTAGWALILADPGAPPPAFGPDSDSGPHGEPGFAGDPGFSREPGVDREPGLGREPGVGGDPGVGAQISEVLARSAAAPEAGKLEVRWWPVPRAQVLDAEQAWVPGEWDSENTELAATPLNSMAILIGRPAMRWLPGELARLNYLSGIIGSVL